MLFKKPNENRALVFHETIQPDDNFCHHFFICYLYTLILIIVTGDISCNLPKTTTIDSIKMLNSSVLNKYFFRHKTNDDEFDPLLRYIFERGSLLFRPLS